MGWIIPGFSLHGRMSASAYRGLVLRLLYVNAVVLVLAIFFAAQGLRTAGYAGAFIILALWIANFAAIIRRMHDRNRTGWWFTIVLALNLGVPALEALASKNPPLKPIALITDIASIALALWLAVELYGFRGTVGDNRFGPDPLMDGQKETSTTPSLR